MDGDSICGTINNFSTDIYFPIVRMDDWSTKDIRNFTIDQIALIYLLGIMFALTAVGAVGSISLLIFQSVNSSIKWQQMMVLFFIFAFNGSK